MTRQEQIKQQAKLLCNTVLPEEYFIMGAEWADNHPDINLVTVLAYEAGRNDVIKEACEWLEQNAYHYCDDIDTLHESALIGDFEYTMKGGKQ